MQHRSPAKIRTLFLGHPDESEKGLAGIGIPAVGVANPNAIVQGLADRPVQPLATAQRLFGPLALRDVEFDAVPSGGAVGFAHGCGPQYRSPNFPGDAMFVADFHFKFRQLLAR